MKPILVILYLYLKNKVIIGIVLLCISTCRTLIKYLFTISKVELLAITYSIVENQFNSYHMTLLLVLTMRTTLNIINFIFIA